MKKTLITVAITATCITAAAQTQELPLWPNGPKEQNGITTPEERREDWSVHNISEASIYIWPADPEKSTGQAVLICPGGGYSMQAAGHEGRDFAEWLAHQGTTAIVLKYRLPNAHPEIPLADAQQAMRTIRRNAQKWNIDPKKVGVMGFSAGGHLAATLLTHYDAASRPDFGVLFYPVITMRESTHGGSRDNLLGRNPTPELIDRFSNELHVTPDTPPTMIFFSGDDKAVPPVNGTLFHAALMRHGVPAALHIFPTGGHGWGFRPTFPHHPQMLTLLTQWLE
ncbi:MAG: alpha/beta hydrolase [Alistipes sp.]|jgi:acetyl esterase/lipase|nr:alpha/beta hydrolase [Alistipes sp.]